MSWSTTRWGGRQGWRPGHAPLPVQRTELAPETTFDLTCARAGCPATMVWQRVWTGHRTCIGPGACKLCGSRSWLAKEHQ